MRLLSAVGRAPLFAGLGQKQEAQHGFAASMNGKKL
jgi:hypothetical protein